MDRHNGILEQLAEVTAKLQSEGIDFGYRWHRGEHLRLSPRNSYARGPDRVDFLYANRPLSQRILDEAEPAAGVEGLRVVSLEGLIGFKLQAFNDDPRRLRDLSDIMELMWRNHDRLNLAEIREYFRLFDREELLNDIFEKIGVGPRDT